MTLMLGPAVKLSSPRTRRYFLGEHARRRTLHLFSAHAEVFPRPTTAILTRASLLRARGGISEGPGWITGTLFSSPRTRRYFTVRLESGREPRLFSAHAEVFPNHSIHRRFKASLLRARGGISNFSLDCLPPVCSSPRTRRYFPHPSSGLLANYLFSAHAEVFPDTRSDQAA